MKYTEIVNLQYIYIYNGTHVYQMYMQLRTKQEHMW